MSLRSKRTESCSPSSQQFIGTHANPEMSVTSAVRVSKENITICFYLQLCSSFKHTFCATHRHCYHFAQRTLFWRKKNLFTCRQLSKKMWYQTISANSFLFSTPFPWQTAHGGLRRTVPHERCIVITLPACCNGHFDTLGAAVSFFFSFYVQCLLLVSRYETFKGRSQIN